MSKGVDIVRKVETDMPYPESFCNALGDAVSDAAKDLKS